MCISKTICLSCLCNKLSIEVWSTKIAHKEDYENCSKNYKVSIYFHYI